jgi:hypothetical protein
MNAFPTLFSLLVVYERKEKAMKTRIMKTGVPHPGGNMTLRVLVTAFTLVGFVTNGWAETIIFARRADLPLAGDIDSAARVAGHFTDAAAGMVYLRRILHHHRSSWRRRNGHRGMNNLGDVAGFSMTQSESPQGFLKTDASVTVIDVAGSGWTQAQDVNDNGVVVGYFADQAGIAHVYL